MDRTKKILRLARTARGQIDSVIRMLEEGSTLPMDVSNQILAAQAVLKSANKELVYQQLEDTVQQVDSVDQLPDKLEEVSQFIDRIFK